ncbi:hypothetical protein [Egbenema bharatensis]|uniref:hypothetical protein n=1 Tax=Egbenema bharatensis TaxID=3463334 RepID=UPI003A87682C
MIVFESETPTNINQLYDELIAQIPAIRPTDEWQPLVIQGNSNFVQISTQTELPSEIVSQIQTTAQAHTPQPPRPAAQWDAFYQAHQMLLLGLIGQSQNTTIATALMTLFGRRRDPDFSRETGDLVAFWNLSIASLLNAPTIATLQQGIQTYHLPLTLSSEGTLTANAGILQG